MDCLGLRKAFLGWEQRNFEEKIGTFNFLNVVCQKELSEIERQMINFSDPSINNKNDINPYILGWALFMFYIKSISIFFISIFEVM